MAKRAAVVWPNGKAYFFEGDQYIRYEMAADKADDGYPQPITNSWAGLMFTGPSGPQPQPAPESTAFAFQLAPGEAVGGRIVRCCHTLVRLHPGGLAGLAAGTTRRRGRERPGPAGRSLRGS